MADLRAQFAAIEKEVRHAIDEVLRTQTFILGPQLEAFEREMAGYSGSRRAIGVASGTDALALALRASGVGPGDEVIVPAFTFLATAGAVIAAGARPVFADSEAETLNIDPESAKSLITRRTRFAQAEFFAFQGRRALGGAGITLSEHRAMLGSTI